MSDQGMKELENEIYTLEYAITWLNYALKEKDADIKDLIVEAQNLKEELEESKRKIAIRDQKIERLEEELVGLRRFERRWHKLLSESEPSPELLSGEAFRLKEQSDKEQS